MLLLIQLRIKEAFIWGVINKILFCGLIRQQSQSTPRFACMYIFDWTSFNFCLDFSNILKEAGTQCPVSKQFCFMLAIIGSRDFCFSTTISERLITSQRNVAVIIYTSVSTTFASPLVESFVDTISILQIDKTYKIYNLVFVYAPDHSNVRVAMFGWHFLCTRINTSWYIAVYNAHEKCWIKIP